MAYDWKKLYHSSPVDVSRGAAMDAHNRLSNIKANNSLALDVEALRKKLAAERQFVDQKKWLASPGVREPLDEAKFKALLAQMGMDDADAAKTEYDKVTSLRRPDAVEFDRLKYGDNRGQKETNPFKIIASQLPRAAADLNPMADASPEVKSLMEDTAMAAVTGGFMNGPIGLASGLATYSPDAEAVVKPKGGNWLSISDRRLGMLKRQPQAADYIKQMEAKLAARPDLAPGNSTYDTFAEGIEGMRPHTAMNAWIDGPLAKYIKNQMATPEDPVRLAIDAFPQKKKEIVGTAQAKLDKLNAKTRVLAESKGVPEEYLTRHRQDVLAAERALRELNLREGIHYQPEGLVGMRGKAGAMANRRKGGFPENETASTVMGKMWERASDRNVFPEKLEDLPESDFPDNTWMDGKPGGTMVNELGPGFHQSLGFDHMIDELYNSIRGDELPAQFRLDPKNLGKITVPQAVEHVDKINAWRGARKVDANREIAQNSAAHTLREYPEEGSGMRWVELKAAPKHDELGNVVNQGDRDLADQLRYEGDTMQHCVGGYCDDVIQGRSRIMSLRDREGQPYATIEIEPGRKLTKNDLPDSVRDQLADMDVPQAEFEARVQKYLADQEVPTRIKQIKGPKNEEVDPKYTHYIKDFLNNPPDGVKWGDVNDLHLAGNLFKHENGKFYSPEDAARLATKHFGERTYGNRPDAAEDAYNYYNRISRYNQDLLTDIDKGFIEDWKAGNFASGGQVKTSSLTDGHIDAIMMQLRGNQ